MTYTPAERPPNQTCGLRSRQTPVLHLCQPPSSVERHLSTLIPMLGVAQP